MLQVPKLDSTWDMIMERGLAKNIMLMPGIHNNHGGKMLMPGIKNNHEGKVIMLMQGIEQSWRKYAHAR